MHVTTKKELCDQDWKTQSVQKYENIPSGSTVVLIQAFTNFYGRYFEVDYNGRRYSVKPEDVTIDISDLFESDRDHVFYRCKCGCMWTRKLNALGEHHREELESMDNWSLMKYFEKLSDKAIDDYCPNCFNRGWAYHAAGKSYKHIPRCDE